MTEFTPSAELAEKLKIFERKEESSKALLSAFEEEHADKLTEIRKSINERNESLEDLKKSFREEFSMLDITKVSSTYFGPFFAKKKRSSWFIPEIFLPLVENLGLSDEAIQKGIIKNITEIDYNKAISWMNEDKRTFGEDKITLKDLLLTAKDGKELTPAISISKTLSIFGGE